MVYPLAGADFGGTHLLLGSLSQLYPQLNPPLPSRYGSGLHPLLDSRLDPQLHPLLYPPLNPLLDPPLNPGLRPPLHLPLRPLLNPRYRSLYRPPLFIKIKPSFLTFHPLSFGFSLLGLVIFEDHRDCQ